MPPVKKLTIEKYCEVLLRINDIFKNEIKTNISYDIPFPINISIDYTDKETEKAAKSCDFAVKNSKLQLTLNPKDFENILGRIDEWLLERHHMLALKNLEVE
jgi:hypothetical protein